MEIRQHLIDGAKGVARLDENLRFRCPGLDQGFRRVPLFAMARGGLLRGVLVTLRGLHARQLDEHGGALPRDVGVLLSLLEALTLTPMRCGIMASTC